LVFSKQEIKNSVNFKSDFHVSLPHRRSTSVSLPFINSLFRSKKVVNWDGVKLASGKRTILGDNRKIKLQTHYLCSHCLDIGSPLLMVVHRFWRQRIYAFAFVPFFAPLRHALRTFVTNVCPNGNVSLYKHFLRQQRKTKRATWKKLPCLFVVITSTLPVCKRSYFAYAF